MWYFAHALIGLYALVFHFTLVNVLTFLLLTGVTLCLGHSLGMHRKLIHQSYQCSVGMECFFVYLGVLVGMAGPFGMIYQHDLRDWAQKQSQCHPYLRHGKSFWRDAWWQLHCDLHLQHAPSLNLEANIASNHFYLWLERTWMRQQLPLALLLYVFGGWSMVMWGVSLRIFISLSGHWLVGHYAHRNGHQTWRVRDAAVQGQNISIAGWLSMGEAWHNNHHAYPGSALLGFFKHQPDPGWVVLQMLYNLNLAWDIKTPEDLPSPERLECIDSADSLEFKRLKPCPVINMLRGN